MKAELHVICTVLALNGLRPLSHSAQLDLMSKFRQKLD